MQINLALHFNRLAQRAVAFHLGRPGLASDAELEQFIGHVIDDLMDELKAALPEDDPEAWLDEED